MEAALNDVHTGVCAIALAAVLFLVQLGRQREQGSDAKEFRIPFVLLFIVAGMLGTLFGTLCFPAGFLASYLSRLCVGEETAIWFRIPAVPLSVLGGYIGLRYATNLFRFPWELPGKFAGTLIGSILFVSPVVLAAFVWSGGSSFPEQTTHAP